jgi:hypothetical protein
MSDLAATNCGGGCSCNEGGCNSILWIIILLCCCGGNGGFCGGNNGCGGNNDCLWIILLLFCCGGCGGNNGCGFCSEMAVGYSGRPIRFIKKNVSACYGRDVFICQQNLRTLCVLIPCSILTVFFPILLLHHLLVDSTFLWHFLFSGTFLIYLINTVSINNQHI